ncbi:MAG TPA: hypothetical protein VM848_01905 [Acidimicrobiia bacterium]|nr:hypothetical protein [Acidimicrobiia bacterium]
MRFEDDDRTHSILERVHQGGDVYPSPSTWMGQAAIRLSVSNWRTNENDVARVIRSFANAAGQQ